MTTEENGSEFSISKRKIFSIFLKTGQKRLALSILSGLLIFLTITTLCMVVYKHRFQVFRELNDEINWFDDGSISAKTTNYPYTGYEFYEDIMNDFTNEFANLLEDRVTELKIIRNCSAIGSQFFYHTTEPTNPWDDYQIIAPQDDIYELFENAIIEGRMPRNETEILHFENENYPFTVNEIINLKGSEDSFSIGINFTIVGIIGKDNIYDILRDVNLSTDLFEYEFETVGLYNYIKRGVFFANFTSLHTIMNTIDDYFGHIDYLADFDYDLLSFKLSKLKNYLNLYGRSHLIANSDITHIYIEMGAELRIFILQFNDYWSIKFSNIIKINSPLFIVLGITSLVSLNIGSKELEQVFRKMKLYGLNYNLIRQMVLLENLITTGISFLFGVSIGLFTNYLISRDVIDLADHYYVEFLKEPLFFVAIIAFFVGFFLLSFLIPLNIAKQSTKDPSEEFKRKRRKMQAILSTNEFRLFTIALGITVVSVTLYLLYILVGPEQSLFTNYTYQIILWCLITFSIAFTAIFVMLLIARLIAWLFSLISEKIWSKQMSIFTIILKHMTDNRNIFQLLMLSTMIIGITTLPSLSMKYSIPDHLQEEALLSTGYCNLIVRDFIDPENELDVVLENMTEIADFTEVVAYTFSNDNSYFEYLLPFEINVLSLENPTKFVEVIDQSYFNKSKISQNDVLSLNILYNVLFNNEYVNRNHFEINQSISFASHYTELQASFKLINSYETFPLSYRSVKPLFYNIDVFSLVASTETVDYLIGRLDYKTSIYGETIKLIKPQNESVIPAIKEKLSEYNVEATSLDDYYNLLLNEVDEFSINNIIFFSILGILSLIFVSYFTGKKIFEDRIRIIEILYRAGVKRRQIIGYFGLELFLVNIFPLILTVALSFPLLNYLGDSYLNIREWYHDYNPIFPAWVVVIVMFLILILAALGWWIAMIPLIYKYRPIKQE
ncbi:MAG: FtsX-like permease family protein [Asgard group archaeon]|nr:FtsX-like permease family protein [Asgard group archaeon]